MTGLSAKAVARARLVYASLQALDLWIGQTDNPDGVLPGAPAFDLRMTGLWSFGERSVRLIASQQVGQG